MSKKGESVTAKSAAEFFSEHQQIAGFDNPGKSLFTTIRELVENSLDAAESIHVLPTIELSIVEFTETEHNKEHNIHKAGGAAATAAAAAAAAAAADDGGEQPQSQPQPQGKGKAASSSNSGSGEQMYFKITCRDNGCGIPGDSVGDSLGRVLSGSKHGVRQTRGKFGLGAKMALIWSKKSSGLPILVRTAHAPSSSSVPSPIVEISLDIDIYKNAPRILRRRVEENREGWRGLEISVTIAGNWSIYRSKVLQYFQQLAVITPYADFTVDFTCLRDEKKSFRAAFSRRSEQMPPTASIVNPHPRSLNNITLANLLRQTRTGSVDKFLSKDLSGVSAAIANKICKAVGVDASVPSSLSTAKIAALCQVLRDESAIKPPSAACLPPAGEYNLRLGVLKELRPTMVATFSDKAGANDGHPFVVEAAISLGGKNIREGINVYRFANRIPLLFEAGADVVTQVANKRINWSSYHIDPKKDSIGVYVSIVSTRIPFKGTSKEYIGDDVTEVQHSVKRALLGCCNQLKANLARQIALRGDQERKKTLTRYIPDIARSLVVVLEKMQAASEGAGAGSIVGQKRKRLMQQTDDGSLTEESVDAALQAAVSRLEAETALQALAEDSAVGGKRVKLFLAVNPATLPDHPAPSSQSSSQQQGKVIDLVGEGAGADDVDAVLGRLVSNYASEYKAILSSKPGARIWI